MPSHVKTKTEIMTSLHGPYTKKIGEPAYTQEAIEVLEDALEPTFNVLEFGSGASTLWVAEKVWWIYTIEHDVEWYHRVSDAVELMGLENVSPFLVEESKVYRALLPTFRKQKFQFNVILIDGIERRSCARHCFDAVKSGGYVLLDNTDRFKYRRCVKVFKNNGWSRLTKDRGTTIWKKP